MLFAKGLPVAEDFDGVPRTDLFSQSFRQFRQRHPLRTIAAWGERRNGAATSSVVDESILEEFAALGSIDELTSLGTVLP